MRRKASLTATRLLAERADRGPELLPVSWLGGVLCMGLTDIQKDPAPLPEGEVTRKKTTHINVLELTAAYRSLKAFQQQLRNKVVKIEVDNTVALSYLRTRFAELGHEQEKNPYCPFLMLFC